MYLLALGNQTPSTALEEAFGPNLSVKCTGTQRKED